jgi:glycerol-3-phosphate dehydrogenase
MTGIFHREMSNFQVAIIGGGVIGSAIAWELAKYKVEVVVFEKGSDVASGTSKANSGVVHSGINSPPSSLKAKFCAQGNKMIRSLADELGFSVKWVGKYVIAKNEHEMDELERLKKIGIKNGVTGLEIHDGTQVNKNEPNVVCCAGLWVPTAGIMLPYEFTINLAENASINGVKFFLETEVLGLKIKNNCYVVETSKGSYQSDILVNAAGLNCWHIVSMLEEPDFEVYPCRGEYLVLDKNYNHLINSMIYPVPVKELGVLGVHITPTIEGNILIGPSAEFINDLDDRRTTKQMMKNLMKEAKEIVPEIPNNAVINAYSGNRCKLASPEEDGWTDYRIEESKQIPGMINLLGIESPGLTSAPAIAKEITKMISKKIDFKEKNNFKIRKKKRRFCEMSQEDQSNMIKKDPKCGRIICRCEHITEAEVVEALSNPLGAQTLSSVKYRCRAGMGRCQGGFCTQHIVRIIEEEFNKNIKDIKLNSPKSQLFYRKTRELNHEDS